MKKIMTIDDSQHALSILKKILESEHYPVIQSSSATEALKILQDNTDVSLIITDIMMPGGKDNTIDGLRFIDALASFEALRNIPIIVISAITGQDPIRKKLEAMSVPFLKKESVNKKNLMKLVIRMIGLPHDPTQKETNFIVDENQKLAYVGKMVIGLIHDIKGTMVPLKGSIRLLDKMCDDKELLGLLELSLNKTVDLCNQAIDYVRGNNLLASTITMSEALKDSRRFLNHIVLTDLTSTNILYVETDNPWTIKINAAQFQQLIMNLVSNARDSMVLGGKITIKTRNQTIAYGDVDNVTPGKYAVLEVTDEGLGMDMETQQQMFKPLFTTKGSNGSGLGLSIVAMTVTQNNGYIKVHSILGKGTTVSVYFPRYEKEIT